MRKSYVAAVAAVVGALVGGGCVKEAKIDILEPPRGAMLEAGQPVTVRVRFEGDSATVNGESLSGGGTQTVELPEVDGLGFVVAKIPGEPLFDVRSYHQGLFLDPDAWQPSTMLVGVGTEPLDTGAVSVSGLVAELLTDEELEPYVEDPITVVGLSVDVTSVISSSADVSMTYAGDDLIFDATLNEVLIVYSAGLISGTVTYDWIDVSGGIDLNVDGVILTGVVSDHSPNPNITVNGFPPVGFESMLTSALDGEIPAAVEAASQNAASAVFPVLVQNLRPSVGVDFAQPITEQTRPESLSVAGGVIGLGYETLIAAETPSVATAQQRVLQRTSSDGVDPGSGLTAIVGSPLVNQMAFAVWDAGNLSGLVFTEAELTALGMPALDFPYDKLNEVEVSLLLPPLLEWGADGPYLDVGGVQIRIDVATIKDSTAWTAARVPVELVRDGEGLRLQVDASRTVQIREVGFDRMSNLADQDKVMSLLLHAVPGVVDAVFGELPMIRLEPLGLTRLDGTDGPALQPSLLSVARGADTWLLELELTRL